MSFAAKVYGSVQNMLRTWQFGLDHDMFPPVYIGSRAI